jgi:hypothetical protein
LIDNISLENLRVTAFHEAGHAVVARLLGISINWITLEYIKQYNTWNGEHNASFDSVIRDLMWDTLYLESKIPYDNLRFEYPTYPEPYEEYKKVRDRCTIDYAGLVTQRLFYKLIGQEDYSKISEGCSNDIYRATIRVQEKFQEQKTREKELTYAESRAEKILSNKLAWRMLADLAEYMVNAIIHGQKEAEKYDLTEKYWFIRQDIYTCFVSSLTGGDS